MSTTVIDGDLRVNGTITSSGDLLPLRTRDKLLTQENLVAYPVHLVNCRVWDAIQTLLPGTPAADDLGITGGTWLSHCPKLTTGDVKNTTTTRYARFQFEVPAEYKTGETVTLRFSAGMETTAASASATLDVEAYLNGRDGTVDGSDLYAGAAQSINSTVFANKDFDLAVATLTPGAQIDVRIAIAVVDVATATAVIASIGSIEALFDIKG